MPGDTDNTRDRWRSAGRILLVVSLALNLLVIGLAVGVALRWSGHERGDRSPPSVTSALYRALPRPDRADLRAEMKARHGSRLARRRDDARALAAALRARPFDAATVEAILVEGRSRREAWHDAVHRAWLLRISAMDDAERAAYAARLDAVMTRHRDGHKKGGRAAE